MNTSPSAYKPLAWPEDSALTTNERECVETQRRGLWEEGVRKEPLLTEMALCFAAVILGTPAPIVASRPRRREPT